MAQQQADALAMLAETALHHGIDPGAPGERYQVVVHIDAVVLADADEAGAVSARGRVARSGGNVSAPGVRCEPGRDAPRSGRALAGNRRPHPHDPTRVTASASAPRPRMSLPGLRAPVRPGPPHSPLGSRRSHHALEPRHAVSPPPSRRARGGLPGRAATGRRAAVPSAERLAVARRPAASGGGQRPCRSHPSAERGGWARPERANRDVWMARGAA